MHTFTSCECVDNFSVANYNIVVNTSLIKVCSFFGHRQIEKTEELQLKIKEYVVKENMRLIDFLLLTLKDKSRKKDSKDLVK